jgi:4-amino-4-deoxy-L-arabinose transferase-like glycosyltransferase
LDWSEAGNAGRFNQLANGTSRSVHKSKLQLLHGNCVDQQWDEHRVPPFNMMSRISPFSSSVNEQLCAATIIAAAFLGSILWTLLLPTHVGPDELAHFQIDWFIVEYGQLPVLDVPPEIMHTHCLNGTGPPCYSSYASQPPVSPLLGAASMKVGHGITGASYDTLLWPARLISSVSIGVYSMFLYLVGRALFEDVRIRLTALAIGALDPQVTFLGAYVNDDAPAMAIAAIVTYLLVLLIRNGFTLRKSIALGLALGLLALTKVQFYPVFLGIGVTFGILLITEARKKRLPRQLGLLVLAALIALGVSGWWFIRGLYLYHDPLGIIVWRDHFNAASPSFYANSVANRNGTIATILTYPLWLLVTFTTSWGMFDYKAAHYGIPVYVIIFVLMIISFLGLIRQTWRRFRARWLCTPDGVWKCQVAVVFALLIAASILMSTAISLYNDFNPQGRYLFSALVPLAISLGFGLQSWARSERQRDYIFVSVALGMIALNATALICVVVPSLIFI